MAAQPRSPEHKAAVDRRYQQAIDRITGTFETITSAAIANYTGTVGHAADQLERALNTAERIRTAIMDPAQKAYDRQVKIADDAIAKVVQPAQSEYIATVAQAETDWQNVYGPAEQAYRQELAAARAAHQAALTDQAAHPNAR